MADNVSVADVCGPFWWGALEGVTNAINCPPCRQHARELLSGMHDAVNLRLGKPVHNPAVFRRVAQEYSMGLARMATMGVQGSEVDYAAERRILRSSRSSSFSSSSVMAPSSNRVGAASAVPDMRSSSLSPDLMMASACDHSHSVSFMTGISPRKYRSIRSANSSRMAQDRPPRVYAPAHIIRQRFNNSPLPRMIAEGQLRPVFRDNRVLRHPELIGEPHGTRSQYIRYVDQGGRIIVEVAQYLRPDGTLGASGRPDPKALRVGDVIWDSRAQPPAQASQVFGPPMDSPLWQRLQALRNGDSTAAAARRLGPGQCKPLRDAQGALRDANVAINPLRTARRVIRDPKLSESLQDVQGTISRVFRHIDRLREDHCPAELDGQAPSLRQAQLPTCTPAQAEKVERCIQAIKDREDPTVNPWAVCQASIGCALPRRGTAQSRASGGPANAAELIGMIEGMLAEGAL